MLTIYSFKKIRFTYEEIRFTFEVMQLQIRMQKKIKWDNLY
jgi:hypothetical protein